MRVPLFDNIMFSQDKSKINYNFTILRVMMYNNYQVMERPKYFH